MARRSKRRRRQGRFEDIRPATPKPEICKRVSGESWRERHYRRKQIANSDQSVGILQEFCDANGLTLAIRNQNHHFTVRRPEDEAGRHLAQWWPQTAKLVFWSQWRKGVHCHDVKQLIGEIQLEFKRLEKQANKQKGASGGEEKND